VDVRRTVVTVTVPLAVVAIVVLAVLHADAVSVAVHGALGVTGRTINTLISSFSAFMRTWGMPRDH
jgi:hypothetical protein